MKERNEELKEVKIDLTNEQLFHLIRLEKRMVKKAKDMKLDLTHAAIHKLALDQLGYSKHEIARKQEQNEFGVFRNALRGQYEQM